jgi:hypothetical protein
MKIASSPISGWNVKELVYDSRLFIPELVEYPERYQRACRKRVRENEHMHDFSEAHSRIDAVIGHYSEACVNSVIQYTRLSEQQEAILENGKDYQALCTGLKKFQNISKVTIIDDFPDYAHSFSLLTPVDDGYAWYDRQSSMEVATALKPAGWSLLRSGVGADDVWGERRRHAQCWDTRGVTSLMQALASYCPRIEELQLGSATSSAPIGIFGRTEQGVESACEMARRLTSLKLKVCNVGRLRECESDPLARILREAKNLYQLSIVGRINLTDLGDQHWPNLGLLNLGYLNLDAKELLCLVKVHEGTLRGLTLRNIYLSGVEGWEEAGRRIGKHLKLDYLCVCSLADAVTEHATHPPYLEDEVNVTLARSLMQSIPEEKWCFEEEGALTIAKVHGCPVKMLLAL